MNELTDDGWDGFAAALGTMLRTMFEGWRSYQQNTMRRDEELVVHAMQSSTLPGWLIMVENSGCIRITLDVLASPPKTDAGWEYKLIAAGFKAPVSSVIAAALARATKDILRLRTPGGEPLAIGTTAKGAELETETKQ